MLLRVEYISVAALAAVFFFLTSDGSSNTVSSVDAGDNGIVGGSLNVVIALTGELRDGSGNVESTEVVLSASSFLTVDGATKGRNIRTILIQTQKPHTPTPTLTHKHGPSSFKRPHTASGPSCETHRLQRLTEHEKMLHTL